MLSGEIALRNNHYYYYFNIDTGWAIEWYQMVAGLFMDIVYMDIDKIGRTHLPKLYKALHDLKK